MSESNGTLPLKDHIDPRAGDRDSGARATTDSSVSVEPAKEESERSQIKILRAVDPPNQKDNWEIRGQFYCPFRLEVRAHIHYRDGNGLETQRDICTHWFGPYLGDYAIQAFCELRQQGRTFLASRILEFVDLSTGEAVANVVKYLCDAYDASPRGFTDKALDGRATELTIFTFVARADGKMTARERVCISQFITSGHPETIDDAYLAECLSGDQPTHADFRRALTEAVNFPPERRLALASVLSDIERARGKMDRFTDAAIATAREKLRI